MQTARTVLWLAWLLLIAPFVFGGAIAQAERDLNARLHGEYAFTQIHFCVQTTVGGHFGDDLSGGATTRTLSNEGFLTFHGDGTGSFDGKSLSINHTTMAVSEADFTCPLTYVVNPDGSFTTQLGCSGRVLSGSGKDSTYAVSDIELHGQLRPGGNLFIANDTNPNVETFTLYPSGGGSLVSKRICGRSQTAIRIRHAEPR